MKKLSLILTIALVVSLLAGCAGTPVVYYSDCTCPTGSHDVPVATEAPVVSDGAVKTGRYIATGIGDSKAATAEENGEAKYDVTMVAVLVDDNGVITDCVIDSLGTTVAFTNAGAINPETNKAPVTKNELGEAYGMKA